MIRALIFDLDNCLAAADEPGESLLEPAFAAIRAANHGTLSEAALQHAFADCWRHPLDWVASTHGFTSGMLKAGWDVMANTVVTQPMHGYGDLEVLASLPAERFLVTSGFTRLQSSKIARLRLDRFFAEMYVDAIDEPNRLGKQKLFERIMDRHGLRPTEVLVVGDNADSEIEAGNRLGIQTVQTLRPGVTKAQTATFHVKGLEELAQKLIEDRR